MINYKYLNLGIPGIKMIMDYAVEGGILNSVIDLEAFADDQLSTTITADSTYAEGSSPQ